MANKKAQFMHLVVLICFFAIGIFLLFVISSNTKEAIENKGVVTSEYLEIFREVQKRGLQTEMIGQINFAPVLENYALGYYLNYGGIVDSYLVNLDDDCSRFKGIRLLIGQDDFCLLSIDNLMKDMNEEFMQDYNILNPDEQVASTFQVFDAQGTKLTKRLYVQNPSSQNYTFSFDDNGNLHAVALEKIKYMNEGATISYSVLPSFDLYLGIPLEDDFNQVNSIAYSLVATCMNSPVLEDCLIENLHLDWDYGLCDKNYGLDGNDLVKGEYNEEDRKVIFCAKSPNEISVFSDSGVVDLEYNFALDFTPSEAFVVSGIEVGFDGNSYQVYFDPMDSSESYRVYVTDYFDADFTGSISKFEISMFNSDVFEYQEFFVSDILDTCPGETISGFAYDCASKLMYDFESSSLISGETYYFTVTSLIGESESQVMGFVSS